MQLTKHHGLGNDFLVVLDLHRSVAIDGAVARALCDRRTGVGADGLIRVTPGSDGAAVTMELWNADGSTAETSGNGIRCLAQAVTSAGVAGESFIVATAGGRRRVEVGDSGPVDSTVTVDMGPAGPGPSLDGVRHPRDASRARTVSMGNPHLVLVAEDLGSVDVAGDGHTYQTEFPATGGINVEWIAPTPEGIEMVVFERGAGVTQACGTGACAAVHAAHGWGLAPTRAHVSMPGGGVTVELGDSVRLTGPATRVASIDIDAAWLASPDRRAAGLPTGASA